MSGFIFSAFSIIEKNINPKANKIHHVEKIIHITMYLGSTSPESRAWDLPWLLLQIQRWVQCMATVYRCWMNGPFYGITSFIPHNILRNVPIAQMRKLRYGKVKGLPKLTSLADFELGSNSTDMDGESSGYTYMRSRMFRGGRAERVSSRHCSNFSIGINLLEQHEDPMRKVLLTCRGQWGEAEGGWVGL